MAIVLTNGTTFISHNNTGGVIKVTSLGEAQDFYSFERALRQKNKTPTKCRSYYPYNTEHGEDIDDIELFIAEKKKKRKKYSLEQRKEIYNKGNGCCQLCGRKIPFKSFTVDHIIPRSMGGTDAMDNLQCTHRSCNIQKASYLPETFFNRISEIFVYQMDKKYGCEGEFSYEWKIARNLIMSLL